jgi:hypothetical protein
MHRAVVFKVELPQDGAKQMIIGISGIFVWVFKQVVTVRMLFANIMHMRIITDVTR